MMPFLTGLRDFHEIGDGSRLKELEVVDTLRHIVLSRYNSVIAHMKSLLL